MAIATRTSTRKDPLHILDVLARRKGDCFVYATGQPPSFLVNRPEYVRHVLVDRAAHYSKDTPINAGFATTIADGLLTSEGEAWRRQRSIMQPSFARRNLPQLGRVVAEKLDDLIDRWERYAADGIEFDLSHAMSQLLFRITAQALFDADTSAWDGRTAELLTGALPVLTDLSEPAFVDAQVDIRSRGEMMVAERLRRRAAVDDLLGKLIASDGVEATPAALRDHVVTMALAGYETTASTSNWGCYLLATHPDVAAELRAHIRSRIGDRPIVYEDLASLPYLTAVVKETMRLYPPAWIIGRRALEPDRIGDTDIPEQSVVAISPYTLHRHPRYWPNPETFDPTRFINDAVERRREPFSYIPFGAGPRTCIGSNYALVEAPMVIGRIMQRFQLTVQNEGGAEPRGVFVLVPWEPIRVRLQTV